ncbi:PEP-CTERM sorting domain-containing protein [Rugamonas rivuli]|uniref:PEP-CTERM sorting domain-containing protein n=1 Tax=Rugamonas rivuli TaxID=2743358 RepID=A0A843SHP1_9BURK|nr:PEP-CTERM sorting domain-containing protein [Rugamonas rivuli]MQA19916.1 PEP-CTERM sorting domain-containing protein [Rugamonas rivuli]
MLKKILAIAFAAATCASATATPVTYNFSYVGAGLNEPYSGPDRWISDYRIAGSFSGEDKDHNGVISETEVSSLKIEGTDIDNTEYIQQSNCHCSMELFSFKLKEQNLFFAASYTSWRGVYSLITNTAVHIPTDPPNYSTYYFTPDTIYTLTAVPEPSTYAMMGAGLLGLAIAQRRRKKST